MNTKDTGQLVRQLATHHDHGDGWIYSRNTGGLRHIRYSKDNTGYNHWTKRLKRALSPSRLLGRDTLSLMLSDGKREPLRHRLLGAVAHFRVNWFLDRNMPDGQINGNLTFWEEDGEYIQAMGPTIGAKVAEFLMDEPDHPHAKAIAEEINRVWAIAYPKQKEDAK